MLQLSKVHSHKKRQIVITIIISSMIYRYFTSFFRKISRLIQLLRFFRICCRFISALSFQFSVRSAQKNLMVRIQGVLFYEPKQINFIMICVRLYVISGTRSSYINEAGWKKDDFDAFCDTGKHWYKQY